MNSSLKVMGGSLLAMLALAGPLRADVTSQQVWDDLEAYMQSFGYSVQATEAASGGDLTVSDVSMSMEMPDGSGTFSIDVSEMVLTDRGDGTVLMTFPAVMPMFLAIDDDDAEDVEMRLDYGQTGLEIVVSGTPGAMVYDYTAETLSLTLAELTVEGDAVPPEVGRGKMVMNGLAGTSAVTTGDMRDIVQTFTAANVTYDMAFSDPDSDDSGLFTGGFENFTFEGETRMPVEMDTSDMAKMMAAGISGGGTFSYANGQTEFSVSDSGDMTSGTISSDTARLGVQISQDMISYETGTTGLSVLINAADMPFPVAADMAETSFNMTLPVAAAEEPKDFALGMTLGGFTMSELLWSLFDPGAQLPRDPATIAIDLVGKATPFLDVFDPVAMAELEESGDAPGELNALTLRGLTVAAAGARLTGTGDFTFNNDDLETFDGMPAPTGTVDLSLSGANALIDKLIAMGLLAEEDAMGARMMMSMFTVPAGEDVLNSTIEITGDGQVKANGQRIR